MGVPDENMNDENISQKQTKAIAGIKKNSTNLNREDLELTKEVKSFIKPGETPPSQSQMNQLASHSLQLNTPVFSGPPFQKKKLLILENIKRHEALLPPFESAKVILKDFGRVKSFSVNTHQGVFRSYNEDRVSILLNAQQR